MDMKELRENADLTRIQVAYHLEIAESTVRNWEKGRTTPTLNPAQFVKLLGMYKCTPSQLDEASRKSRGEE